MRRVSITVDADISLAELMRAAQLIGCTLAGDGQGGLMIVQAGRPRATGRQPSHAFLEAVAEIDPAGNVIAFARNKPQDGKS